MMREFFKPWRRKFGLLTLMLALVSAVAWHRSKIIEDRANFSHGNCVTVLLSHGGKIVWLRGCRAVDANLRQGCSFQWSSVEQTASGSVTDEDHSTFLQRVGFDYDKNLLPPYHDLHVHGLAVPYWSLTISLTVISVWLLLSRPRQSTSVKLIEPIPEKVV